MYSGTTSALFSIIICTSAFWNVKATTTGVTLTEGHAAASTSKQNVLTNSSASTVAETTLSSVLNTTFNHDSTTVVHSTTPPPVTPSAPVKNSSVDGSTTTLNTLVTVPGTEHENSTVTRTTTLLSSASETGHLSSTANGKNTTIPVLPTQESSTLQGNTTITLPSEANATSVPDTMGNGMKYSETVLTSIFGTVLVVVLLTMLAFCFNKYRKQRSQYSHHPLHENVYESEAYSPPDDTLVISGGLYDAPRIYNPNMTVLEEDDAQHDYVSFSSRPGQFRLEFLPGDKETDPANNGSLRRNV